VRIEEVADILRTLTRRTGSATPGDPGRSGDSSPTDGAASPTIRTGTAAAPHPAAGSIENADTMVTFAGASRMTGTTAAAVPPDPASSSPAEPVPGTPTPEIHALTPQVEGGAPPVRRSNAATGTVLGGRYRLEELLAETSPTVSWRAFDLVLSRSVLVHLLPPHDPDAERLLAIARQAAVATDSRFLRVLDAVSSDDDEIGCYIVCEYAAGRSLEVILSHGPLSGLEAAWVVREVADALSGVHSLGLHHQRISPDTVILTPDGHVKIVGLVIEAALRPAVGDPVPDRQAPDRHGPVQRGPEQTDVADLGRLLYACLVSRWPGGPAFSLPAAPTAGRHWLSPRQVRAGVSPSLDSVCDQILGDPPRHRAPRLASANEVVDALTKVLGTADASSDLERRLRQPIPRVTTTPPSVAPNRTTSEAGPSSTVLAATSTVAAASGDATRVTVIRQPPPPHSPVQLHHAPPPTQRRSRRWTAVVALMGLLLVATGVVAAVLSTRGAAGGSSTAPAGGTSAGTPSSTAPVPPRIVAARDFDPQGDPPNDENGDEVRRAYDKNPATRWRTVQYLGDPKLGGLKRGVGLVLDLGEARSVSTIALRLSGNGTAVQIRVPEGDPTKITKPPMRSDGQWRTVSRQAKVGRSATLRLDEPTTTRFVLVYLTSLPKEGSGYRGGIYEVEVL
jgi:putative peptidoglycan lipid II flippase